MLETLKKNKISILVIVVLFVGFFGYKMLFPSKGPLVSTDTSTAPEVLGQDLVNELNRLRSLSQINSAIFVDPVFVNLRDIQVPVQPQQIGRQNPFLPIGS